MMGISAAKARMKFSDYLAQSPERKLVQEGLMLHNEVDSLLTREHVYIVIVEMIKPVLWDLLSTSAQVAIQNELQIV